MDFLENAVNKAKEAIDVVSKKTGEVVTTQKQKFDVASIESKRNKDFMELGKIYYQMIKDSDIENAEVKALVDAIVEKSEKIKAIKEQINSAKNKRICPKCSANIDEFSIYCSVCGEKLEIESED